ncbi:hypothetical protein ATB53_18680 [Xanthomonas translucens]|uniref:Uncharacterized protein n=1 Tax=Xanthomonas campestris pv. translucens TaxID=343 RepID=A0A120EVU1_XANCT|nr:hypothetical protein ATB53_18680 [Xanthomonas translucens]OAX55349.1 hypothetical protein A6R79_18230 [Xanthomonas translucens pv. translucens]
MHRARALLQDADTHGAAARAVPGGRACLPPPIVTSAACSQRCRPSPGALRLRGRGEPHLRWRQRCRSPVRMPALRMLDACDQIGESASTLL